ncbi:MAG: DUF4399 domain-containing protein [Nitriliruptorales bacterium]|nr:DUF4399 domain-containing protein [Nitriliruptorales bacterium]
MLLVVVACVDDAADDQVPEEDPEDTAAEDDDLGEQPADAQATFTSPSDGDVVSSPVQVEMATEGITVAPAGDPVVGEGHLHVIVDQGCLEDGEVVPGPSDSAEAEGYHHFGDGSTSGEIDLEPGTYELCLQIADGPHRVYGSADEITITVE